MHEAFFLMFFVGGILLGFLKHYVENWVWSKFNRVLIRIEEVENEETTAQFLMMKNPVAIYSRDDDGPIKA